MDIITNYNLSELHRRNYGDARAEKDREAAARFSEMMGRSAASGALDGGTAGSGEANESLQGGSSMEAYQKGIYDRISRMPVNFANGRLQITIRISDAAFERMKSDPAYENEIMSLIEQGLGENIGGQGYLSIEIGKELKDYRISMVDTEPERSAETGVQTFWERRVERFKELQEELQQKWEKEQRIEKVLQRHIQEEKLEEEMLAQRAATRRVVGPNGELEEEPAGVYFAGVSAAELLAGLVD